MSRKRGRRGRPLVQPAQPEDVRLPDVPDWVYSPARDHSFSEDRCFLCGATLDETNRTNEHVFPRWLLEEFDLWDQRITLLNQTSIPYRQLVIPCCSSCNGQVLRPIEDQVLAGYRAGHEALAALDRTTLFLWLAKIFYGLLFREMFLPFDRADHSRGPIVPAELVARYTMHHLLLQAARGLVEWSDFPASIYAFRCQQSQDKRRNFDFGDNPPTMALGIRMGHTALFALLQDFGALQDSLTLVKFEVAAQLELHPWQFREVLANGIYAGWLFNRTPKMLVAGAEGGRLSVLLAPLGGFSGAPLFDEFDRVSFVPLLAHTMGLGIEDVASEKGIRTWLQDDAGNPLHIPIDPA